MHLAIRRYLDIVTEAAKPRFYYHMTSSRNLSAIQQQGLIPGDDDRANWGFGQEDNTVFFGNTPEQAQYYGDILKHGMATGPAPENPYIYFAMLRVSASKLPDIEPDPETRNDSRVHRIVPPHDIEIAWGDHGWRKLVDMDVRGLAIGEWDDEPDETEDETDEPDESPDQQRAELMTLAQQHHPDKSEAEIRERIQQLDDNEVMYHLHYYRTRAV